MTDVIDLWITRTPRIEESEWVSLLSARSDFTVVEQSFGRTTDGKAVSLGKLYLWHGADGEVPFSFSKRGIHIASADSGARALAQALANALGAQVEES